MSKRNGNDQRGKKDEGTEKVRVNRNGSPYGKGSGFCGKKGRSGAPRENRSHMRHGMFGSRLPDGCQYIEIRVNILRKQVEEAVVELKGEVGLLDAAAINSILKWERHGLLAAHWLREGIETLSASDRLRFSEAMAKASDARDKNIRLLGLDIKPEPIDLNAYLAGNAQGGKGQSRNGLVPYGLKELPVEPESDEEE
jgi:hypothetical protein